MADEEAGLGDNDQTNDISIETELNNEIEDKTAGGRQTGIDGLGTKPVNRDTSFFAQPGILAGQSTHQRTEHSMVHRPTYAVRPEQGPKFGLVRTHVSILVGKDTGQHAG